MRRIGVIIMLLALCLGAVGFLVLVRPEVPERARPQSQQPTQQQSSASLPVQVAVSVATEPAQPTASPSPPPTAQPTISPTPLPPFIFKKGDDGFQLVATTEKIIPTQGDQIVIDDSVLKDRDNWGLNLSGLAQFVVTQGEAREAVGDERLKVQVITHVLTTGDAPEPKPKITWPQNQVVSFLVQTAKDLVPTPTPIPAPTDTAVPPTPTSPPPAAPKAVQKAAVPAVRPAQQAPVIVRPPVQAYTPPVWSPPPPVRVAPRPVAPAAKPVADTPVRSASPGGCSTGCP